MDARRLAIAMTLFTAAGCEKSPRHEPAPAPTPVAPVATVADAATAPAPVDDAMLDQLVTDTISYTTRLWQVASAFDGDCGRHIDRLLTLEPTVTSIRERTEAIERSADAEALKARFKDRMTNQKDGVMAVLDRELAAIGKTRADVAKLEATIQSTCGDDPRVEAAMNRVGLFKKKKP